MGPHTTLTVEDGVAIVRLVNPPVNALHPAGGQDHAHFLRIIVGLSILMPLSEGAVLYIHDISSSQCWKGSSTTLAKLKQAPMSRLLSSRAPMVGSDRFRGALFLSLGWRVDQRCRLTPSLPTWNAGKFCAGFDINQFTSNGGGGIDGKINEAFLDLLECGPKPTVAAIEALALGGGCEVAMACNARVCTPGQP
jgi:hypothetical protein